MSARDDMPLTRAEVRSAIEAQCANAAHEAAGDDETLRDVAFEAALQARESYRSKPAEKRYGTEAAYVASAARRGVRFALYAEYRGPEFLSLNVNGALELEREDGETTEIWPAGCTVPPHDIEQLDREAQQRTQIEELLQCLTVRERQAIQLRFLGELQLAEIASQMGVSVQRVSQLVSTGTARMRRMPTGAVRAA
jgi:RNA polymerase sigma factor (sigma-70 family)